MGLFDVLRTGASWVMKLTDCYAFSNQSVIKFAMGTSGAITQAVPVMVADGPTVIYDLKLDLRITGVRILIDEYVNQNELGFVVSNDGFDNGNISQNISQNPQAIAGVALVDPTFRQIKLNALALVKVATNGSSRPPFEDTVQPSVQFQFDRLVDIYNNNEPTQAPLLTDTTSTMIWQKLTQLSGDIDHVKVKGGFVDGNYPGYIVLNPGDYLQLCYFGSNNYLRPTQGMAGMWGRLTGVISWEVVQPGVSLDDNRIKLNAPDSIYKRFITV